MIKKILNVLYLLFCLSGVLLAILHFCTDISVSTTLLFTYNAVFLASLFYAEFKKKNYLKLCLYLIVPTLLYLAIIVF